jgi:hypothetical protein
MSVVSFLLNSHNTNRKSTFFPIYTIFTERIPILVTHSNLPW